VREDESGDSKDDRKSSSPTSSLFTEMWQPLANIQRYIMQREVHMSRWN